jgi:hypothetical protein
MRLPLTLLAVVGLATAAVLPLPLRAADAKKTDDYPEPSPYPISWEFNFEYDTPKRLVVNVPGSATPKAYWYMPYTVTNEGDETHEFVPQFELMTEEGKLVRAKKNVPKIVFDTIKSRERNKLMVPPTSVGGDLQPGVDQARDSVAVFEEPEPDMGTFKIFAGGLSGEFVELKDKDTGQIVKDSKGQPIVLRKTLQLTYSVNGDEVYPGEDVVRPGEGRIGKNAKTWVMR